jgi:formylglycine-generating enzyme required for sulfatase activity
MLIGLQAIFCCLLAATEVSAHEPLVYGGSFRDCSDCPEMVMIPPGTFLMGTSASDAARELEEIPGAERGPLEMVIPSEHGTAKRALTREQPQHSVTIPHAFALGKYDVTRREFAAFVSETGYKSEGGCFLWIQPRPHISVDATWDNPGFSQGDRDPVVCVRENDVRSYIGWLNSKLPGGGGSAEEGYRLPTEAEWEYSARAGTDTSRPWGNAVGGGNAHCLDCGGRWGMVPQTTPPDPMNVNNFGLVEMLGNAWQPVEDCWHDTYEGAPSDGSSWSDRKCGRRVMRGGSWFSPSQTVRSAARGIYQGPINDIGFRVARNLP